MVYAHSHAGNCLEGAFLLDLFIPKGVSVFLFDFSGSGESSAPFVTLGSNEQEDLSCVINYLSQQSCVSRIGVWGRSMGASAALLCSWRFSSINVLILDSPFDSLRSLISQFIDTNIKIIPNVLLPSAVEFVEGLLKEKAGIDVSKIAPVNYINCNLIPAFFLVGACDTLTPKDLVEAIFQKYNGEKEFQVFPGDHTTKRKKEDLGRVMEFAISRIFRKKVHMTSKLNTAGLRFPSGKSSLFSPRSPEMNQLTGSSSDLDDWTSKAPLSQVFKAVEGRELASPETSQATGRKEKTGKMGIYEKARQRDPVSKFVENQRKKTQKETLRSQGATQSFREAPALTHNSLQTPSSKLGSSLIFQKTNFNISIPFEKPNEQHSNPQTLKTEEKYENNQPSSKGNWEVAKDIGQFSQSKLTLRNYDHSNNLIEGIVNKTSHFQKKEPQNIHHYKGNPDGLKIIQNVPPISQMNPKRGQKRIDESPSKIQRENHLNMNLNPAFPIFGLSRSIAASGVSGFKSLPMSPACSIDLGMRKHQKTGKKEKENPIIPNQSRGFTAFKGPFVPVSDQTRNPLESKREFGNQMSIPNF